MNIKSLTVDAKREIMKKIGEHLINASEESEDWEVDLEVFIKYGFMEEVVETKMVRKKR